MKSGQTLPQKIKAERVATLRELLSKQGHLQHSIELIGKLKDLKTELEPLEVRRIEVALAGHMKLLNKYLPDMRDAQEEAKLVLGTVMTLDYTGMEKEVK
tara:strand:- start:349 stop:648 length:300 start_codon:yes stop_codon:yes gene_type:complete